MQITNWPPIGESIVSTKPSDGWHAGDPGEMESAGVASHVQAAGLDECGEFEDAEIAGEYTPRAEIQGCQKGFHLGTLALAWGAGEHDLLIRVLAMDLVQKFCELFGREFFVVFSGEGAHMDPSPFGACFLKCCLS